MSTSLVLPVRGVLPVSTCLFLSSARLGAASASATVIVIVPGPSIYAAL